MKRASGNGRRTVTRLTTVAEMTPGPLRVPTARGTEIDVLHGVLVPDPYRWLEDSDGPGVAEWVDAQNRRTREVLDGQPERTVWSDRLTALMRLPVVQGAQVRGDRLVLLERGADAQQARLVARIMSDPEAAPDVLADPASESDDAAIAVDWFFVVATVSSSPMASVRAAPRTRCCACVRTTGGDHLSDEIPNCRAASVTWEPDGTGFFYTRYPDGDEYHRTVHHHTIGAPWRDDPVVWADHPTPQTWPSVRLSPDGRFLLVDAMVGWNRSDQHVLDRTTGRWTTLVSEVDATTHLAFASDTMLVGTTTIDAPRGRIVTVDLTDPLSGPDGWTTLVDERDVVVGAPVPVGDDVLVTTTRSGVDTIERWSLDGSGCHEISGVGVSSVAILTADRGPTSRSP